MVVGEPLPDDVGEFSPEGEGTGTIIGNPVFASCRGVPSMHLRL